MNPTLYPAKICLRTAYLLTALLTLWLLSTRGSTQSQKSDFKAWGLETLKHIEEDYALPNSALYADEWKRGQKPEGSPAFMWGAGVQLSALTAATRIQPQVYKERLKRFVSALEVYWTLGDNNIGGYDVLPHPKPLDRYYDDNMWVGLALVEAYEVTKDKAYRDKAEAVFAFILTVEDDKLGGGIYWKEKEKTSKNTCSNAPAMVLALRLFQVTHKQDYMDAAKRLYDWTNAHLQAPDGLFWDNIRVDGTIEKTKWSYNTALMLRANCLFYSLTHEKPYYEEAERIARSAASYWVKVETGAIADDGAFAHLLAEAFLAVSEMDGKTYWRGLVDKALTHLYTHLKDEDGHYSEHWNRLPTKPHDKVGLLSQASVARAFLRASLK